MKRLHFLLAVVFSLLVTEHCWALKMEAGQVTLPGTIFSSVVTSVTFSQSYSTPPVVLIMMPREGIDPDSATVRIRNVTTTGFQLAQFEPRVNDGRHYGVTVDYFVIEPGVHQLPSGDTIEAGFVDTQAQQYNGIPPGQKSWQSISFSHSFSSPIFLGYIQTANNSSSFTSNEPLQPWMTLAVNALTSNSVDLALERSEAFDKAQGSLFNRKYRFNKLKKSETIGYVVLEAGIKTQITLANTGPLTLETRKGERSKGEGVRDWWNCKKYSLTGYANTPLAWGQFYTHSAIDGGWLRRCGISSSEVGFFIEEDIAQDIERSRSQSDDLGFLVVSKPFSYDSAELTPDLMLEAQEVSLAPSQFTQITFQQVYEQPPAVFVLADENNPEPTQVRIRNITRTGFEAVPVEPPASNDDADRSTKLHYLAVAYGEHEFPDGTKLEVNTLSTRQFQANFPSSRGWIPLKFANVFSQTPAVIAAVQTMNNETAHVPGQASVPWLSTAIRNVATDGMQIALERAEVNQGQLQQLETIAYLAVTPGVISGFKDIAGEDIEAEFIRSTRSIQGWQTCNTVTFNGTYTAPPLVIGAQNSRYGNNGGWLRRCAITNTEVTLDIDEDTTADNDRNHTKEVAGLGVFSRAFAADFSLVAHYPLEGPTWTGVANEVKDVSGNGIDGNALGQAKAVPAKVCYGAELDGNDSLLRIPDNPILDIEEELTVMAWVRPHSFPGGDLHTIISKDENYEFHLNSAGQVYWWWKNTNNQSRSFRSNTAVSLNAWNHITVVYSYAEGKQTIYLNGAAIASRTYQNEKLRLNNDPFEIGADQGYGSRQFDGDIDEVKVFKRALSAEAVAFHSNIVHPCLSSVDHYGIATNGTAVTCMGSPVTITAYAQDGSEIAPNSGTQLNISTNPQADSWVIDSNNAPAGTLTAGVNGSAQYQFSGSEKSAILYVQRSTSTPPATPINIDVSDGTHSESASKDDSLAFIEAGLVFDGDQGQAGIQPIATQIAGKTASLSLHAVRTDNNTGACLPLFSGNQTLSMASECVNPGSCSAGRQVRLNSTAINAHNLSASLAYTDVNLVFSAQAEAPLNYQFNDAGTIRLHAKKQLAAQNTDPAITLTGQSADFLNIPAGFCVEATDANAACASPYAQCSKFRQAEQAFNLQVSAVTWEQAGEANSDFCSGSHQTTPNFSLANIPLELSLIAPVGGTLGSLGVSQVSIGGGSQLVSNQSVSEVGAFQINLNIDTRPYQGETLTDSQSADIGRFYPAYFRLSANTPVFANQCILGSPSFTYQQQPFGFVTAPEITLTAYGSGDHAVNNYGGDFNKHASIFSDRSYSKAPVTPPATAVDASLTAIKALQDSDSYSDTDDYDGDLLITIDGDQLTYHKTNMLPKPVDAPFNADVNLTLTADSLKDGDDVCVKTIAAGSCLSHSFEHIGGTQIRYGRAHIENNFGPETGPLEIPMQIEYWDGSAFQVNTGDSCSSFASAALTLSDYQGALQDGDTTKQGFNSADNMVISGGTFSQGLYPPNIELQLTQPSNAHTGSVKVVHTVPIWLRVDGNGDGDLDDPEDHPFGVMTFGQYRGHDRIIFWRELHY